MCSRLTSENRREKGIGASYLPCTRYLSTVLVLKTRLSAYPARGDKAFDWASWSNVELDAWLVSPPHCPMDERRSLRGPRMVTEAVI